tara:strand:+ start:9184 stop:9531 length:348 start_codon:yes stop_codon:yes gene_type:complete
MITIKDLLAKYGLQYQDLSDEEIGTLRKWSEAFSQKTLTLPDIKNHINTMIDSIEREITGYESPPNFVAWFYRKRRMRQLHARLANLIVLRDFCSAPERAQEYVEKQLAQMANQK